MTVFQIEVGRVAGRVEFLAKIRKNRIRIPPLRQFEDGSVVKVILELIKPEAEEEKEED